MKWKIINEDNSTNNNSAAKNYKTLVSQIKTYFKEITPRRKKIFKQLCKIVKKGLTKNEKQFMELVNKCYSQSKLKGSNYNSPLKRGIEQVKRFVFNEIDKEELSTMGCTKCTFSRSFDNPVLIIYITGGQVEFNLIDDKVSIYYGKRLFDAKTKDILEIILNDRWRGAEVADAGLISYSDALSWFMILECSYNSLKYGTDESLNDYERFINEYNNTFGSVKKSDTKFTYKTQKEVEHELNQIKYELKDYFGDDVNVRIHYGDKLSMDGDVRNPNNVSWKGEWISNKDEIMNWWNKINSKYGNSYGFNIEYAEKGFFEINVYQK